MSALLSFLGGSIFRAIWGELAAFLNKRQDHQHETEMLRIQADLDEARHKRDLEQLNLQASLGIRTIAAKSESEVNASEAEAFRTAMEQAFKPSGIFVVDLWNGLIRPVAATIALVVWVSALITQAFVMSEWDRELVGVILGFWFASRVLGRGK